MNNLNELISNITPLYNEYKNNKNSISWTDALLIMLEIGENLNTYIEKHRIAPHNLYRQIYWKSEGKENIAQKSYITREFLWRCYRIYKLYKNKENIEKELPNLKKFITFREAMPFFDNEKYVLKWEEREVLLKLLNSNMTNTIILKKIKDLQKEKIGIKNPRTQKLDQIEAEKKIFIDFYNFIFKLIKNNNYDSIIQDLSNQNIDINYIKSLAQNTNSLVWDDLKSYTFEIKNTINGIWKDYWEFIKDMISQKDPKKKRRFRRIIPWERIARLWSMLIALTSENYFNQFH